MLIVSITDFSSLIRTPFGLHWDDGIMICHFECYHLHWGGSSIELMEEQMIKPRIRGCDVQLATGVLWVLGGRGDPWEADLMCEILRQIIELVIV